MFDCRVTYPNSGWNLMSIWHTSSGYERKVQLASRLLVHGYIDINIMNEVKFYFGVILVSYMFAAFNLHCILMSSGNLLPPLQKNWWQYICSETSRANFILHTHMFSFHSYSINLCFPCLFRALWHHASVTSLAFFLLGNSFCQWLSKDHESIWEM